MLLLVDRMHNVEDGHVARAAVSREYGELAGASEDGTKHGRRVGRRGVPFDDRAQAHEVDEDRLAVASIGPVSRMLHHVGVDGQVVCRRCGEAQQLVRAQFAEGSPASRRARDVRMDGAIDVGNERSALRTRHATRCGERVTPLASPVVGGSIQLAAQDCPCSIAWRRRVSRRLRASLAVSVASYATPMSSR